MHAVRALTKTDHERVEMADRNGTPSVYGVIYFVEHLDSGKVYIGQTTTPLAVRWRQHKNPGSSCRLLGHAIKKHGVDAFCLIELDTAETKGQLDALEVFYIALFRSQDRAHGYNLEAGGSSGKASEETKALLSKARKGKPKSPGHVAKVVAALTGKKASLDARAKMSAARKALWADPDKRANMQQASTQAKQAEAYRLAVSETVKRQRSDPASKAKLAAAIAATKVQGDLIRAAAWKDPVKRAARRAKMNETRDRNKALRAIQQ